MHDPPLLLLPALVPPRGADDQLAKLLDRENIELLAHSSLEQLDPLLDRTVGEVLLFDGTEVIDLAGLAELLRSRPHLGIVVGVWGRDFSQLRTLAAVQGRIELVVLPEEAPELGRCIRRVRFEAVARRLKGQLKEDPGYPPVLNAALRIVLSSRLLPPSLSGGGPVGSLKELAERVGVSREYLSRLASSWSLELREVADEWRAIQAIRLRQEEALSAEEIAWRCGYSGHGGLSNLLFRVWGARLSEAAAVAWEERVERLKARLAG